jgi:hypothetical protein
MVPDLSTTVFNAAIELLRALGVLDETPDGYHIAKSPSSGPSQSSQGFDDFWCLYPRKVAKVAAQKAWKRQNGDAIADTIIASMLNHPSFLTSDPTFIPHASTWLNQRRWEDEKDNIPKPAINLNTMIREIEERQVVEREEQYAYLRKTGLLPGNGVSKKCIPDNGPSI